MINTFNLYIKIEDLKISTIQYHYLYMPFVDNIKHPQGNVTGLFNNYYNSLLHNHEICHIIRTSRRYVKGMLDYMAIKRIKNHNKKTCNDKKIMFSTKWFMNDI